MYARGIRNRNGSPNQREVVERVPLRPRDDNREYVTVVYREPGWIWNLCAFFGIWSCFLLGAIAGAYIWIAFHNHSDIRCDIDKLEDVTDHLNDTCCGEPIDGEELCDISQTSLSLDCLSDVNITDLGEGNVLRYNESTDAWESQECGPCVDGEDGQPCWDIDGNGLCDLQVEDVNDDGVCNQTDCIGERGEDGMDGANATIDECEKPFGQVCLADEAAPEFVAPFTLNITENTWATLSEFTCMIKSDENVNASALGCKFNVTHNDSYKITIDTSFRDNTPPEESVWVGLSINGVDPLIKQAFPSDTGHFHTMSFSIAVYLIEGDMLEVQYYAVNSSGLVDIFRLQFTVVGELLCGFDVTGPPGPKGVKGDDGDDGYNCWDTNANYFCDLASEDINGDGICTVEDCTLANITYDNITGDLCSVLNDTSINCLGDVDLSGIQENDTLVYKDGQFVTTSIEDTEILRRALVNSTIPTNFRFNDPNGDPSCTTSSSFIELASFIYLGTTDDIDIGRVLAIVSTTNTAATGEFRLTDLTNTNTIIPATSFGATNDVLVLLDTMMISNLPTDESILQLGIRRVPSMGGGSVCLHSVQVLG